MKTPLVFGKARHALGRMALIWLVGLVFGMDAHSAKAQDLIRFRAAPGEADQEKECEILGDSPRGVKVKIKNEKDARDLDPALIVYLLPRVSGKSISQMREPLYRAQQADREVGEAEKAVQLKLAVQTGEDFLSKVTGTASARGWALLVARFRASLAETEPDQTDQALTLLNREKAVLESGWTEVPALLLTAHLQQVKGDNEGAQRTLTQLAAKPGLTPASREEIQAIRCRLLIRLGKFPEALAEIAKLQDPASKTILGVALDQAKNQPVADAEAKLRLAIARTSDSGLKALGCNVLGEAFLKADRKEDAFWEFLKVDTLYSQDRTEEAHALFHLSTLFDGVRNDPGKAGLCREKLKRPFFAGTEFQSRLR